MIARFWHGAVPAAQANDYFAYLQRTGISDLEATPGNLGVYVLRRTEGATSHFVMTSLWESRDAIRAFAGDEIERARYYPEDAEFLLDLEPECTHYEVLHGPGTG